MEVSLCMIVKNEEDVIARCLSSILSFVSEIIIVDTGSTDKTKEICKTYTNKIFDFKWCDNFSKARNFAFSKATKDYIMWLDADDVISNENLKKLNKLKENFDKSTDIFFLKYDTMFDEQNNCIFSYYRERILKRANNYIWQGYVHEAITPSGKLQYLDISIEHRKLKKSPSKRNLKIYQKMLQQGIKLNPRENFYYARELFQNSLYNEAIIEYKKFLKMEDGYIENKISACKDLANYYILENNFENAYNYLFLTFLFDLPRADICCDIAQIFLNESKYELAIYWYNQALACDKTKYKNAFCFEDSYDFIPYIQLCVCYYKLNDFKNSKKYNELAGTIKPTNKIYLNNKKFFSS